MTGQTSPCALDFLIFYKYFCYVVMIFLKGLVIEWVGEGVGIGTIEMGYEGEG